MGGLLGYSSENSIRSLNVPAKTEREEREREKKKRMCEEHESFREGNSNVEDRWGQTRQMGNNWVTKNTASWTPKRS